MIYLTSLPRNKVLLLSTIPRWPMLLRLPVKPVVSLGFPLILLALPLSWEVEVVLAAVVMGSIVIVTVLVAVAVVEVVLVVIRAAKRVVEL
jgi:hypothetical protein